MPESEDILGVAALIVGSILYLWRRKRQFDRTNTAGIEQFDSYAGKVSTRVVDGIIWLTAVGSLMTGVIVLAVAHNSTWGWVVLLPLAWVAIFGVPVGRSK